MKQKKQEMDAAGDSDSDGFESVVSDDQCESYHSDEEMEDTQVKDTSKQESKKVDDDGFEQVQEKRRRR